MAETHQPLPLGHTGISVWTLWTSVLLGGLVLMAVIGFLYPDSRTPDILLTAVVGCGAVFTVARFGLLNSNIRYLWPAILLSMIGSAAFVRSRISGSGMSYGAGMVPAVLTALACLIPASPRGLRHRPLRGLAMAMFIVVGVSILLSALSIRLNHESMLAVVLAVAMGVVARMRRLLVVALCGLIIYTLVRPSSTVVGTTAVVFLLGYLSERLSHRTFLRMMEVAAVFTILTQVVVMFVPRTLEPLLGAEALWKKQVVGVGSNNEFRAAVIQAASEEFREGSLLFGKMWTGSINATGMRYFLPWWGENEAPIHSDFAITLQQGGLVGLFLLGAWWLGMIRMFGDGARRAVSIGAHEELRLFHLAQVSALVVMLFMSFNPVLNQLSAMLPYYVVVWVAASSRLHLPSGSHAASTALTRLSKRFEASGAEVQHQDP